MTEIRLTVPRDLPRELAFHEPEYRIGSFLRKARIPEGTRQLHWSNRGLTCTLRTAERSLFIDGLQSICRPGDEVRVMYDQREQVGRFYVLDGSAIVLRHLLAAADESMRFSIREGVPNWFFQERDATVDAERRSLRKDALVEALLAMVQSEVSRLSVYAFATALSRVEPVSLEFRYPDGSTDSVDHAMGDPREAIRDVVSLLESVTTMLGIEDERINPSLAGELLLSASGLGER